MADFDPKNGYFEAQKGLKIGLLEGQNRAKIDHFRPQNRVFKGPWPGQRPSQGPELLVLTRVQCSSEASGRASRHGLATVSAGRPYL